MRRLILLLAVFGLPSVAWAEDSSPKPSNETLGFDAKKVKPPAPEKGEPIARLFYDYIDPADLGAMSRNLTDDEARRLTGLIFGTLRRRYIEQNKITATPEEIQQFVVAHEKFAATDQGNSERENKGILSNLEAIGVKMVKEWKFDRALYRKYGGTVIFQQANPFEPVGAYRKFLEKMEKAKVFEIYDKENRTKFWHYFTRKHPFQLSPQDVNFDKPWWAQKP